MSVNRGKDFEARVRKAFEQVPNMCFERLADPMAGYAGVKNICDFEAYKFPFKFYFECKSVHGNTLNLFHGITNNQFVGLMAKSACFGVVAGVLVWFVAHDRTVFVPIQELDLLTKMGHRSLNISHVSGDDSSIVYFDFPGRKRRVLFDYDANALLKDLFIWAEDYWQVKANGETKQ